jgi:hypothetical protein
MNDEEEKQVFDTLATSKQVLDSGAKLLAMRDEKIKALEAKLGEWRARAENAELELETARERLGVLDEVLDDALEVLTLRAIQFLASDQAISDVYVDDDAANVVKLRDDLYELLGFDVAAIEYVDPQHVAWTRFGLELRRRAKQREQKR